MRPSPVSLTVVPPSDAPQVTWPPPAGGPGVAGRELADRIARFYAAHPTGRVVTELVTRAREAVVFRAAVYRRTGDAEPAATGWAASGWSLGPGFDRAEEAAVARALAHLGFAGSPPPTPVPARETDPTADALPVVRPESGPVDPARAALLADVEALVARAERYGLRPRRGAAWRAWLRGAAGARVPANDAALRRAEQRLRAWVERRRAEPYGGAL